MADGLRWDPYFMKQGDEYYQFWKDHLDTKERNILLILGRGFDPRMCASLEIIFGLQKRGICDCMLIEFDEGPVSPSLRHAGLVKRNLEKLRNILKSETIYRKEIKMWSDDGFTKRRISSRSISEAFNNVEEINKYSDIIIDISAMPRCIYFALVGKMLYLIDNSKKQGEAHLLNLHIVVSEDVELDKKIAAVGVDESADYIHGFRSTLDQESSSQIPKIWIPVLGEGQQEQLERIYNFITPYETCPVLPFPSSNPRRGDDLLIEYRKLLFDVWHIEPQNIIYASEKNPFELYRQIHQTVSHYNQSLLPLGGCKIIVSAESSKLLSVGALLAVYELKEKYSIGIAHVEAEGYEIEQDSQYNISPFTIWLAGECYE